ncbi:MAG: tetratricopeptide repeat protein [Archaeoglobaceae archaeon]
MNVEEFVDLANRGSGDPKKLCELGEKILETVEGQERGRVLGTLGNLYFELCEFEKAEKYYLEALEIYIKLSEENEKLMRNVAGCLFNLGNLYQVLKKFFEARKCYMDAIAVMEFLDDPELKFEIFSALGVLEIKLGNYESAEELLKKALEVKKDVKNMNNLAIALMKQGKREEAEKVLREALKLGKDLATLQNLLVLGAISFEEIESFDLPIEILAKVKYLKAKKLERDGKDPSKEFFEAGCLGFLAIRSGFESVNYMHCFDRAMESKELSKTAEELKKIILRFYYNANVELENSELLDKIKRGDFGQSILGLVLKAIAEDIKRFS